MKTWKCGKFINVEIGDRFFVGRSGSGMTVFGENATLTRATSTQLVFITDSGATVKTAKDNLYKVYGKAKENRYFVSPGERHEETDKNLIHENVRFWDRKKCKFVNK